MTTNSVSLPKLTENTRNTHEFPSVRWSAGVLLVSTRNGIPLEMVEV